jgi:hypothetical protein
MKKRNFKHNPFVFLFLTVLVLLMFSSCAQKAPYKEMDSLDALKTALSEPEDADIIFPDLSGFDLSNAMYRFHVSMWDRSLHDGYAIYDINHPDVRYGDTFPGSIGVSCSKYEYKDPPIEDYPESTYKPIDGNMEYDGIPIEYYQSGLAEPSKNSLSELSEYYKAGSLEELYIYKFEMGENRYQVTYCLYFPPEVLSTIDTDVEIQKAQEVFFGLVASIIDQGGAAK